jgi:hypothetical protein
MSSDDFESWQRKREDSPMSRWQSLTLLVASLFFLGVGGLAAPVVLGWVREANRPHFGRQSIDTMANVGEAVEGFVLVCAISGLFAAVKGLARGR